MTKISEKLDELLLLNKAKLEIGLIPKRAMVRSEAVGLRDPKFSISRESCLWLIGDLIENNSKQAYDVATVLYLFSKDEDEAEERISQYAKNETVPTAPSLMKAIIKAGFDEYLKITSRWRPGKKRSDIEFPIIVALLVKPKDIPVDVMSEVDEVYVEEEEEELTEKNDRKL